MPRKHGDYQSVREAILAAAAGLFVRNGIDATSLQDIATAAQLSKGTLYYYYPTKDLLIEELAHSNIEVVTEAIFTWMDSLSRGDDMHLALCRLVDVLCEDQKLSGLHMALYAQAAMGSASLQRLLADAYHEWTVMFEVGALKVQSRDAAALRERSQFFFTMLLGYLLQTQSGISAPDKDGLIRFFIDQDQSS